MRSQFLHLREVTYLLLSAKHTDLVSLKGIHCWGWTILTITHSTHPKVEHETATALEQLARTEHLIRLFAPATRQTSGYTTRPYWAGDAAVQRT